MISQGDRSTAGNALRLLVSTGEVSGDLQGSYLIQALHREARRRGISLQILALGGHRMATAGAQLIGETTSIGSVGIFEAIPYLLPTLWLQRQAKQYLQQQPLDLAIFIDYMNPNMNLGRFLRQHYPDLPTVYYIAPQQWVWAFSEKDTATLVSISDRMVAVFPEEATYYRRFGADVSYFGHPLVDTLQTVPTRAAARTALGLDTADRVITLLPASRFQEVRYILPLLLTVARRLQTQLPETQFLIPLSMGKLRTVIERKIAASGLPIRLVEENVSAIAAADLVINKSGTVNLEVGLMNIPQVVVYRLNPLSARIGYYLLQLRLKYVSPVNLFLNQSLVPEFIQWEATPEAITQASLTLLNNAAARQRMLAGYAQLREQMGQTGVCDRVASYLLTFALERKTAHVGQLPTPDLPSA